VSSSGFYSFFFSSSDSGSGIRSLSFEKKERIETGA
jgi:hypothetical protein